MLVVAQYAEVEFRKQEVSGVLHLTKNAVSRQSSMNRRENIRGPEAPRKR